MKAYSLVNKDGEFSVGIYTSLKKCYAALKILVEECLEFYAIEQIKDIYLITEVILDSEPLDCYEFSMVGKNIPIDWEKVLDK